MMLLLPLLGLAFFILGGCAPSLAELRQQPPDHTATLVGTPDQVSQKKKVSATISSATSTPSVYS